METPLIALFGCQMMSGKCNSETHPHTHTQTQNPLYMYRHTNTNPGTATPTSAWWFTPYIALHPSLFSIYLIKLRHVPFNHSSSSFTPPVLPLSISIPWSGGRMKVRHTPATVKVLSLSPLNSSVQLGSGRLDRCLLGWLSFWIDG